MSDNHSKIPQHIAIIMDGNGRCDLVIAIGTRLEMPTMRWASMMEVATRLDGGRKLIRIDIDPEEMGRLDADVGIVADSADGVAALIEVLAGHVAPDNRAEPRSGGAFFYPRGRLCGARDQIRLIPPLPAPGGDTGMQHGFAAHAGESGT